MEVHAIGDLSHFETVKNPVRGDGRRLICPGKIQGSSDLSRLRLRDSEVDCSWFIRMESLGIPSVRVPDVGTELFNIGGGHRLQSIDERIFRR